MLHGETKEIEIKLADEDVGKGAEFKVGTIFGDGQIVVSQQPVPNNTGWSTLPGTIQVQSIAVDGPRRTVTYDIQILLGGGIINKNFAMCQVIVQHDDIPSIITGGTSIITDDGFRVTYPGPLEVPTGRTLRVPVRFQFQVLKPDGLPAKGALTVTLRASASDPDAVHATAELDAQGMATIPLDINWPAGTILELLFSHEGKVYKLANLAVTP
jgi:hypothetical protein